MFSPAFIASDKFSLRALSETVHSGHSFSFEHFLLSFKNLNNNNYRYNFSTFCYTGVRVNVTAKLLLLYANVIVLY